MRQKIKVNPELKEIYVYTFVSMSIMCCLALIHLSTEHFIKKPSNSDIKSLTTNLTKYEEKDPQLGVISKKSKHQFLFLLLTFMFSKRATKIDENFTVDTTYCQVSNWRRRFGQFLWPSQKTWTLRSFLNLTWSFHIKS